MIYQVIARVGYGQVTLLTTGNAEYAAIACRALLRRRVKAFVARKVTR